MTKVVGKTLKFHSVRLSFPVLKEPRQFKGEGIAKYSTKILLDPLKPRHAADYAAMKEDIARMVRERWGKTPPGLKLQFHGRGEDATNQETGEIYEGYRGMLWVQGKSEGQPKLVNTERVMIDGREQYQPIDANDEGLHAGMFCNVTLNLFIPNEKWGKQICCGLRAVQALGVGTPFGGGVHDTYSEFADFDSEDLEDDGLGD